MSSLNLIKAIIPVDESRVYPVNIPDFPGFYDSYLSFPDDSELYYAEETYGEIEGKNADIFYDCIDYRGWKAKVGRLYLEAYQDKMVEAADFLKGFEFEFVEIDSPREYNFTTDKLAVDMKAKSESIHKLIDYCINTKRKWFGNYLAENFTSYDGFWSFWPNNINDWMLKLREENLSDSDFGFMIIEMVNFVLEITYRGVDSTVQEIEEEVYDKLHAYEFINWDKFEKETGLKPAEE